MNDKSERKILLDESKARRAKIEHITEPMKSVKKLQEQMQTLRKLSK